MSTTRISVVTASYNCATVIADALRSVAAQDYPHIEHIVVDGGSTDGTIETVRCVGRHVARCVSEPDRGIYDAMNKGITMSSGDVIGTLNADDFYASPRALSLVAEAFRDSTVDAVWGDLCYVRPRAIQEVLRYWRSSNFHPGLFAKGWCPPHPTFFVRRTAYERYGIFDLSYRMGNDIELMARMLEVHRLRGRHLPHVLVTMRAGGVSNRSFSAVVMQNREILRAFEVLGIRASLPGFLWHKLVSRSAQFMFRPAT